MHLDLYTVPNDQRALVKAKDTYEAEFASSVIDTTVSGGGRVRGCCGGRVGLLCEWSFLQHGVLFKQHPCIDSRLSLLHDNWHSTEYERQETRQGK